MYMFICMHYMLFIGFCKVRISDKPLENNVKKHFFNNLAENSINNTQYNHYMANKNIVLFFKEKQYIKNNFLCISGYFCLFE